MYLLFIVYKIWEVFVYPDVIALLTPGDGHRVFCRYWLPPWWWCWGLHVSSFKAVYLITTQLIHYRICQVFIDYQYCYNSISWLFFIHRVSQGKRPWAAAVFILGFWLLDLANNTVQVIVHLSWKHLWNGRTYILTFSISYFRALHEHCLPILQVVSMYIINFHKSLLNI